MQTHEKEERKESDIGVGFGRQIIIPAMLSSSSSPRLELTDQGMVRYALKTAYRDGTTHVVFERGGLPYLDLALDTGV